MCVVVRCVLLVVVCWLGVMCCLPFTIVYGLLFWACCVGLVVLVRVVRCLLGVACFVLCVVCCVLVDVVCWFWVLGCRSLFVLVVVRLFVVRFALFVACCSTCAV